jgi:hypothetical protein
LNVWFILLGVGLLFVVFYYFLGKKFGIREGATFPADNYIPNLKDIKDDHEKILDLEKKIGILMMKKGKELKSPEGRGGVKTKKMNEGKGVTKNKYSNPITRNSNKSTKHGTTDDEEGEGEEEWGEEWDEEEWEEEEWGEQWEE